MRHVKHHAPQAIAPEADGEAPRTTAMARSGVA